MIMYLIQTVSQRCRPQAQKLCQQNSSVNIRLQVNPDLAFDLYSIVLIGTNIDRTTDIKICWKILCDFPRSFNFSPRNLPVIMPNCQWMPTNRYENYFNFIKYFWIMVLAYILWSCYHMVNFLTKYPQQTSHSSPSRVMYRVSFMSFKSETFLYMHH